MRQQFVVTTAKAWAQRGIDAAGGELAITTHPFAAERVAARPRLRRTHGNAYAAAAATADDDDDAASSFGGADCDFRYDESTAGAVMRDEDLARRATMGPIGSFVDNVLDVMFDAYGEAHDAPVLVESVLPQSVLSRTAPGPTVAAHVAAASAHVARGAAAASAALAIREAALRQLVQCHAPMLGGGGGDGLPPSSLSPSPSPSASSPANHHHHLVLDNVNSPSESPPAAHPPPSILWSPEESDPWMASSSKQHPPTPTLSPDIDALSNLGDDADVGDSASVVAARVEARDRWGALPW